MENWITFREFTTRTEAEIDAEFLLLNNVDCKVSVDEPIPGLVKAAYILVPKELLHRANYVFAEQDYTEEELAKIAESSALND